MYNSRSQGAHLTRAVVSYGYENILLYCTKQEDVAMNNPVVLLIHGMGTHTDESIKQEFESGLRQCMAFFGDSNFNVTEHFTLKAFNYSRYWDEKRNDYAEYMTDKMKGALALTPALIQKLHGLIAEFGNDDFLHTHLLDVLFYLTGVLREHQLVNLVDTLAHEIRENINDLNSGELIVVAHSLGTAFIHDALTQIYPKNLPRSMALEQLWSVATVSRLTHLFTNKADPVTSNVVDHSPTADGVCNKFYPIYNRYDPFCFFKRYRRKPGGGPFQGEFVETRHIRDLKNIYGNEESLRVNPHDLREYFADPEVGGRFLFVNGVLENVTLDRLTKAKSKYVSTTLQGSYINRFKEARHELETLSKSIGSSSGATEKGKALVSLYKSLGQLRDGFRENQQ